MKLKFYKTISILVIFALAACVDSACPATTPQGDFCLRPKSVFERGVGFSVLERREICPGVELVKMKFQKGERSAEGSVFVMQPWAVDMDVAVYPEAVGYNFYTQAITKAVAESISAKTGREVLHVKAAGRTTKEAIDALPEKEKRRLIMSGPATQGGFWTSNTFVIKDGQLIRKTAPSLHQTLEQFNELTDNGKLPVRLNGPYNVFVINSRAGRTGNRWINLKDGIPQEDVSDIILAVSGPAMIIKGDDVSGRINGYKGFCPIGTFEVNWPPKTTATSFAGWGSDGNGNIIYAAFVGNILCTDLVGLEAAFNLVDLTLNAGSIDIDVQARGEERLLCQPNPHSDTAEEYPDGRPVAATFFALEKEFPHWEDMMFYLLEKEWQNSIAEAMI